MENKKATVPQKIWTPLLLALAVVFGIWIGYQLSQNRTNKRSINSIIYRTDRLEQLIELINDRYVDSLSSNMLYEDAINGILQHLDPHTVYIPASELSKEQETLDGKFFGVGIEYNIIRDTIIVLSVVEQGPAWKVGVEMGDRILKVDDSIVSGVNINSERLINLLKGKQYSMANLLVLKTNGDTLKTSITRDVIPIYSINAKYMLSADIGLIKIDRFAANTYKEFKEAVQYLRRLGMEKLIIDLRDNPGGYLEVCNKIVDELLDGKKIVVTTKGRQVGTSEYVAETPGDFEKGDLVILINESSASASEILAGAVQDWDRGVIIGRKSFGKGLVQHEYSLGDGSAIRLTVARYFTPSGRCIQRDYHLGKQAYSQAYIERLKNPLPIDTLKPDTAYQYFTKNGRPVEGEGGITPDIYVPFDSSKVSGSFYNMVYSNTLRDVIWQYYKQHRTQLLTYKKVEDFDKDFKDEQKILKDYLNHIDSMEYELVTQTLKVPQTKSNFLLQIRAQLARLLFRDSGYYFIQSKKDASVQKALDILQQRLIDSIIRRQVEEPI